MTNDEAITQFATAMQSRHLTLTEGKQFIADGQWHRCAATNKSNKNDDGSYWLRLDGPSPVGQYRNWTDGRDLDTWHESRGRPFPEAERAELDQWVAQQRAKQEEKAAELADQARERARRIWADGKDASPDHPYLKRKQVKPHGLRVSEHGQLLVPMCDPEGSLVNLQLIDGRGQKWFLKGGRAKGCYFQIDGKLGPIVVAEGFATAASVNEATGYYVVVAFNASNLTRVATMARQQMNNVHADIWRGHKKVADDAGLERESLPQLFDAKLIVAADDDWKTKGNPGLTAALRAARAARALVAVPYFDEGRKEKETDFNDIAVVFGSKDVTVDIQKADEPKQLLSKRLNKDPHSVFDASTVELLAAFRQDDLAWYERLLADLKPKKIRIRELDREVKAAGQAASKAPTRSTFKAPAPVDMYKLAASAEKIITCDNVLERFSNECRKVIAGESTLTKLLYLSGTSRLLDKAMHVAIKGPSAVGKSEGRRRVLEFFPPEAVISFTALSEKALLYFKDDFAHKILSMGEAISQDETKFQDYILRELLSEGKLRYPVVQKQTDGTLETITIEKNGPVAFMVTTTRNKLHPENETRMLSIEVDDSPAQTRAVLGMVAQIEGLNKALAAVDFAPWHDYQRWLAAGERRVIVPFADELATLIPPRTVRLRRDLGQLLRAIKAHALLHRDARARSNKGSIVATIDDDYVAVRELMADLLATTAEVKVREAIVETVDALRELEEESEGGGRDGVQVRAIAAALNLDMSSTRRRLTAAEGAGYIENLEDRARRPGRYVITADQPVTGDKVLLPTFDQLWDKYEESHTKAARCQTAPAE